MHQTGSFNLMLINMFYSTGLIPSQDAVLCKSSFIVRSVLVESTMSNSLSVKELKSVLFTQVLVILLWYIWYNENREKETAVHGSQYCYFAFLLGLIGKLREKLPKHRLKGYGGDPVWIHVD